MLTRAAPAVLAGAALATLAGATEARADRPREVTCPPGVLYCLVEAEDGAPAESAPAIPQPESGGGEVERCFDDSPGNGPAPGTETPCFLEGTGWWSAQYDCYLQAPSEPIAFDDPRWDDPATATLWRQLSDDENGVAYASYCPHNPLREMMWLDGPPDGQPEVDVEALAQQAVEQMGLRGPDIGIVPEPDGRGTVGVPAWMWNAGGAAGSSGPISESATAGSVTVTAEAVIEQIAWEMGDGATVTCAGDGTPYDPAYGMAQSPDCGHLYTAASDEQPGGQYQVTAVSTWQITWEGGGQAGVITTTRDSSTSLTIGELDVLN